MSSFTKIHSTPGTTLGEGVASRDLLRMMARYPDREAARHVVAQRTQELLDTTGRGMDLSGADLAGLDLSGFDLRGAGLNRALLHSASLDESCLAGASLVCAGMERTSLRKAVLRNAYLHGIAAHACNFDDADLSDATDMTGGLLHGCSLRRTRLDRAMLAGTTFYQCRMDGAFLAGAEATAAVFNECHMEAVNIENALIARAMFIKCSLADATFAGAIGAAVSILQPVAADRLQLDRARLPELRLSHVVGASLSARELGAPQLDMINCHLAEADFSAADLREARIAGSSLVRVALDGANLTGASIRASQLDDLCMCSASAENISVVQSSLQRADLSKLRARAAIFRDCNMAGANLREAYLYRAMITGDPPSGMRLTQADLTGANLVQAYIAADLTEAKLRGTEMAYVRLNQSTLDRADMRGARLPFASLVKVSMCDAILGAFDPPVFVDRAAGLDQAIEKIEDDMRRYRAKSFFRSLSSLLSKATRIST